MINLSPRCCVLNSHKCSTSIQVSEFMFMETAAIVTCEHLNLSTIFCGQSLLRAKLSFEWRLSPGFGTQKKCPFPRNGGVPTTELTNSKIMWTFFRDQILSPLNGDVPWTEVSQRRGSTVSIFLSCGKKRMVSLRCSGQETKILNEKYIMQYIK